MKNAGIAGSLGILATDPTGATKPPQGNGKDVKKLKRKFLELTIELDTDIESDSITNERPISITDFFHPTFQIGSNQKKEGVYLRKPHPEELEQSQLVIATHEGLTFDKEETTLQLGSIPVAETHRKGGSRWMMGEFPEISIKSGKKKCNIQIGDRELVVGKKERTKASIELEVELDDTRFTRPFNINARYWRKRWLFSHSQRDLIPITPESKRRIQSIRKLQDNLKNSRQLTETKAQKIRSRLPVSRWDIQRHETIGAYSVTQLDNPGQIANEGEQ